MVASFWTLWRRREERKPAFNVAQCMTQHNLIIRCLWPQTSTKSPISIHRDPRIDDGSLWIVYSPKQLTKTVFQRPDSSSSSPVNSLCIKEGKEGQKRRPRKKLPFHSRKIIRRHLRAPFSRCNKVEEGRRLASVQKREIMEIALRGEKVLYWLFEAVY